MKGPRWNETIALFGGRFDPPHRGHFEAIRGLFQNPGIREVWVLPSPTPPHKPAVAPLEHRVAMARLGLLDAHPAGASGSVRLDLREMERAKLRPDAPTYTFDTLQELRREIPHLAFVIGTDQLEQFSSWHRFPEVLKLSHWIVLGRKPAGVEKGLSLLRDWESSSLAFKTPQNGLWSIPGGSTFLTIVPTEAPELSSTWIRETIARTGQVPENTLQPSVSGYLKQNALYGIRGGSD